MTTTVTIPLTIDATVAQNSTDNHGTAQFLSVYTGSGDARRVFAHGPRSFPLGAKIISSKLRARQQSVAASASRTLIARLVSDKKWGESTIKWSNQPAGTETAQASVTVTGAGAVGRVIEWDVTAMTTMVSQGAPFYGFRIHSQATSPIRFFSQESGQGLEWEVTYSTAPAAPSRLSPSSGRAVSIARPVLTFGSTDARGGSIEGYRVQLFSGTDADIAPPSTMNERVATFNINGVNNDTFMSRLNGLGQAIVNSEAALILLQECSDNLSDQPGLLLAKVKELSGSTNWVLFNGPNLNCTLVNTAVFEPQWPTLSSKGLGDGKWATAMLLKHVASGAQFIAWNTHYLVSSYLAEQIKHTKVLIPWLAGLASKYGAPLVGGGDFNAKSKAADRPIGMFTMAGYTLVRDLADPESIINNDYDSLHRYEPNLMQGHWIDHLFVNGGPRPTLVGLLDSGSSSDHNLVYADVEYASAQVVVAGVGEPTFDTGEREGSIPQWLMERDVEVDEVLGYRAMVLRGGEWSDWSDVAFFTRVPKPALSIINPGGAPDDFVSESTPPFIAELEAGATQTAYRVLVTDPVDRTVIYWDSRRQGLADMTVTPSTPLGLTVGEQYRVEWQSEDDVPREATPGDPIPVIAERLFTFQLSNTVAPVDSIGPVFQDDERPHMTVPFRMTTAPDGIEVLRRPVDAPASALVSLGVFSAEELHVSGIGYEFIDRNVPPRREYVWTVRRIVNGVTSAANPTAAGILESEGAWVCSEDGKHAIVVAVLGGGNPVSWESDEDVDLQRPLGGSVVRPVTHSIFGRSGRIEGEIQPWGGQTIADARAELAAMRPPVAPYGTPMILTTTDQSTRIFWVGVEAGDKDEFGDWFPFSAEIHEVPDGVA